MLHFTASLSLSHFSCQGLHNLVVAYPAERSPPTSPLFWGLIARDDLFRQSRCLFFSGLCVSDSDQQWAQRSWFLGHLTTIYISRCLGIHPQVWIDGPVISGLIRRHPVCASVDDLRPRPIIPPIRGVATTSSFVKVNTPR